MFFQQIVREDLGCAAYLVGSTDAGTCVVVDPRVDEVDEIIDITAAKGMRVTAIVETHNHADHVAGHEELAKRTGANVYVHASAGVSYPHHAVRDGDEIRAGEVTLRVVHTPGHRPEHIALEVAGTSRSEEPWLVLTGDSLFIGDVARPDLAVDGTEGAQELYTSLFGKLLKLSDGVEIYPGHVAGSLCGRAMNLKTSSTIGYERRHNGALQANTQSDFVRDINANLPQRPPNMQRIVEINKGAEDSPSSSAPGLSSEEFDEARHEALVLDVRSPGEYGSGHVPGALNVDLRGPQFGTRVGFVVPSNRVILLVLSETGDLEYALTELAVVGYTRVRGVLTGGMESWQRDGLPVETIPQVSVAELRDEIRRGTVGVLDVREDNEWQSGHIENAVHIPFHQLTAHVDDVPRADTLAVVCGSGQRSSIATSILQAHGVSGLQNVEGGMSAWNGSGYETTFEQPVEQRA